MATVIIYRGLAGSTVSTSYARDGDYLRSWDVEAHNGMGWARWTPDITKAHKFMTPLEAWDVWRSVPSTRPLRDDGKPNRPLTAITVEIKEVPDETEV